MLRTEFEWGGLEIWELDLIDRIDLVDGGAGMMGAAAPRIWDDTEVIPPADFRGALTRRAERGVFFSVR